MDLQEFTYNHEYHQTLVYKIFCAQKPNRVVTTFREVLDIIGRVYEFTLGIKQIVYLVGWQYDGHDSKYPAWFEVNHRLKRSEDSSAIDSLLWLMKEARRYNAIVSLHINMCDAYENSPLWEEYVKNDLLVRDKNGSLVKGGIWGGEQSYLVSKYAEWESGFAKKRIDRLLDMLPISEAGTIHIDVFTPRPSLYHGISYEDDLKACYEIIRYWKLNGVDVTKEWFHHEFAGMIPMVWHLNLDEASRIQYPPYVICGGGSSWNTRHIKSRNYLFSPELSFTPEGGCLYEEAWGHSVDQDVEGIGDISSLAKAFYLKTLPWYFLNRHKVIKHVHTPDVYEVYFSSNVVTSVRKSDRHFILKQGDSIFVENTDLCLPALWRDWECIAYSENGCSREWELPINWQGISQVRIQSLYPISGRILGTKPVRNRRVKLLLNPGEAIYIKAI